VGSKKYAIRIIVVSANRPPEAAAGITGGSLATEACSYNEARLGKVGFFQANWARVRPPAGSATNRKDLSCVVTWSSAGLSGPHTAVC